MSIDAARQPEGYTAEVLSRGLSWLASRSGMNTDDTVLVSNPVPTYVLAEKDGELLPISRARHYGWDVMVAAGDDVLGVISLVKENGHFRCVGTTAGDHSLLAGTIADLEADPALARTHYELRLISVPQLHRELIWLRSDNGRQDRIVILDRFHRSASAPMPPHGALRILQRESLENAKKYAEAQAAHPDWNDLGG